MNFRDLPLRWIVVLVVLLGVGAWRVSLALRPTEDVLRARIESLVDALEERQPKRIVKALTRDFRDEDAGYGRSEVSDAARAALLFGDRRLRGSLDPVDGFELLTPLEDGAEEASVRIHCLIEARPSGTTTIAPFEPWWDLTLTADLVRRGGVWKIVRTRDVNHRDRPRW